MLPLLELARAQHHVLGYYYDSTVSISSHPSPVHTRRSNISEEHRKAVSDSIKAKWQDPAYREYMTQRMKEGREAKLRGEKLASPEASSSGGVPPGTQPSATPEEGSTSASAAPKAISRRR